MACKDVGDMKSRQQIRDWLTYQDEKTERARSLFLPNEKEISHGRMSWQTPWVYFALGPLEIGIEKSAWTVSYFVNVA